MLVNFPVAFQKLIKRITANEHAQCSKAARRKKGTHTHTDTHTDTQTHTQTHTHTHKRWTHVRRC